MAIVPFAKSLYLCDYHIGYDNGKVDLYGLFNAIRPEAGFPNQTGRFCVFAQLVNGQSQVPFYIDIRFAESDTLVHTTETRTLTFFDRTSIVQLALTIQGCQFQRPGLYLLELFCDNTWVCDAPLLLH